MSGILEFAAILFGYGLSPAGAAGVPPLEGKTQAVTLLLNWQPPPH